MSRVAARRTVAATARPAPVRSIHGAPPCTRLSRHARTRMHDSVRYRYRYLRAGVVLGGARRARGAWPPVLAFRSRQTAPCAFARPQRPARRRRRPSSTVCMRASRLLARCKLSPTRVQPLSGPAPLTPCFRCAADSSSKLLHLYHTGNMALIAAVPLALGAQLVGGSAFAVRRARFCGRASAELPRPTI